jgi:hypothetical protein
MQTFLTSVSFSDTADSLDYRRLGKQRVEAMQILRALKGLTKGWVNHPATKMWRGYERQLAYYGNCMCTEWIERGYKDTIRPFFIKAMYDDIYAMDCAKTPDWLTPDLIASHRSNLVRKMPEHYSALWPDVPDDLPYVWPVP